MPSSKRFTAPLILVFGVIIAAVAFAGPAQAYPPGTLPTTSVSNQTPAPGSSVTFCGSAFQPGEIVGIALDTTAQPPVTADSSGAFCTTIVLGVSLTGTHTLTAVGLSSGSQSSMQIQIASASASGSGSAGTTPTTGGLAFTGAEVIGLGALGGLLLVGGATMVLASRRRKANT